MGTRVLTPELMDDPAIDASRHSHALRGLSRLNRLSFASRVMARSITSRIAPGPLHVLDVATGAGDVAQGVLRVLRRQSFQPTCTLADISEHALSVAASRTELQDAECVRLDVLRDELPPADVVMCSLFLHHLEEDEIVHALRSMSRAARRLLVVSDLRRSPFGTLLARAVPRLVTRSDVVHTDAVRSARGALTIPELSACAQKAGLADCVIRASFPSRMVLLWQNHA